MIRERISRNVQSSSQGRERRSNTLARDTRESHYQRDSAAQVSAAALEMVCVPDTAEHLLVVTSSREAWPGSEAELIALARCTVPTETAVVLCRIGNARRDAQQAGADRFVALPDRDAVQQQAALLAICRQLGPKYIVLAHDEAGCETARFLAAALGVRPAIGVVQIRGDTLLVPLADGRCEYARPLAAVMTIRPVACRNLPASQWREARVMRVMEPAARSADNGLVDTGLLDTDVSMLPIEEAQFILSAGDGLRDFDNFKKAARLLSATIGGSRVVCDAGKLPRHRQVGASGHIARAQCYLAMGISGAPQHLEGIRNCQHVVAVNTDANASMVQRADLAIIADVQQVMPALIAAMEARHG